ncbi:MULTISPECIES: hypothetical protein [Pontibacillus]|uniref:Holin n=1 Tax=Pontibacillus chungwhensis TaxID=265426 RepID=A0ABY8UU01_9BACI|nr:MULTISPECIES: hypothetical protein [Pontibacillus]MCD5323290.1 hypothetical protein [Pontibacillus sp. HN14]WIF96673.1 hypothetical protein QNI29_13035 [Pontibacillus chungwhensis]
MKWDKVAEIIFTPILTGMLIYDYFLSSVDGAIWIKWGLLIGWGLLIVISIFLGEKGSQILPLWEIGLTIYIVSLLLLFTLLGGESASGLSLSNPVLWVVVSLTLMNAIWKGRKNKRHS